MKKKSLNISTKLARAGINPKNNFGIPNPPVYHASTILYPDSKSRRSRKVAYEYGRYGTPTSDALSISVAQLYEAEGTILTPSGLAAAVTALLTFIKAGDHILVTDSTYGSTRNFMTEYLPRIDVEVEFYHPNINFKDLKKLLRSNTTVIYFESPGSHTFEIQDLPALSKVAKKNKIITLADNTWATSLGQNSFKLGIDVVIESFTKYVVGHSDVMMGGVISNGKHLKNLKKQAKLMGQCSGPDDIFLALRGLRTMELRLKKSFNSSLIIAEWISTIPLVKQVLHPGLTSHPDHLIFKRDFKIGAGLFAFVLNLKDLEKVDLFIDSLKLFGIGASWGGFESLILESDIEKIRFHQTYNKGTLIRLAIGMEDPEDLIDDLNQAFEQILK